MLDVGCGTGPHWAALRDAQVRRNVGLDISQASLLKGSRRGKLESLPRVDLIQADLRRSLPFQPNSFDVVLAVEVLEHLVEQESFAHEVHRVLISKRLDALREHTSQYRKYGDAWISAVEAHCRLRDFEMGVTYAEAFEAVRFEWQV